MTTGCDIAVHLYEPGDGGLDRVAILLANGFAARGLKTELWLARENGPVADMIDVPVRRIATPPAPRGLALALQLPALRRAVATHRPRLLLSAGNQGNLSVALAARGTATASVGKITNPVDRPGAHGAMLVLRKARFGATARASTLTLVLSEADAARYRLWFGGASVESVRNPYVTDAMLALGNARAPATSRCRLVSVGRLAPQKDHATLLTALATLENRDWTLAVVGDGPLRAALEAQAASLGIAARVTFAGFADPLPYYTRADLFVLSSRWEGLPAVALEALACGLPVVATDCAPGLAEMLKSADLSPPSPVGDAQALSKAIARALDARVDIAAMRSVAEAYTIEASIDDHLRCFAPFLGAATH